MAEFVMLCPACNAPIIAGTGLFSKKNIECACGMVGHVEKMAEEKCAKCGNAVVYDRSVLLHRIFDCHGIPVI